MLLYIIHRILYNLYDFVMKEGRGSVPLHTLKVNYLAVSYLYKVNGIQLKYNSLRITAQ